MFYLLLIPFSFVSVLLIIHLKNLKKHDAVLYKFCQVRRESMQFLRANWSNLPKKEYIALRELLETLNATIHRYNEHKTVLFNLRRFIEHIKEFDSFSKKIEPIEKPETKEIRQFYLDTSRSFLYGFFAYTPLIKSEILVKLVIMIFGVFTLLGINKFSRSIEHIANSINNAREQAHNLGVHC